MFLEEIFCWSTSGVTVLLCVFSLLLLALRGQRRTRGTLPPGPRPWPLVGNLLQMGEQVHLSLTNLRVQYGDVFQVKMGSLVVVVLSGYSTVKEALVRQGEAFAGRPDFFSFSAIANGESMTFSEKYGETWVLHKKICRNALKTFSQAEARDSSASCLLEERICAEALEMVEALKEQGNEAGDEGIDPSIVLVTSVANVVCALCFGKRYNYNDTEFLTIVNINTEVLRLFAGGNLADLFPIFRYLPSPSLRKMFQFTSRMNAFMERNIKEHLNTFDRNCIRDITDALIAMCEDREEDEATLSNSQIVRSVIDIFGAGFDTIITGLQWSILYLIKFPDIQAKIFQEIDNQVGTNRLPQFNDKPNMPYTEAFMYEVFRHSSYMPFTIPHCTTENITFHGYFIPKDTCVFINQYQVNHDMEMWGDPESFHPERFLSQSGNLNKTLTEKVMIFGMGIRRCLGDNFARLEIFVFLTTLLQRLNIENVPGQELDLSSTFALSMKPKHFRIKITPRN
ncbi:cytochrome P450 1A1 [Triplophysa dalaica]|uniref:cytochrome P450 1A1 n=1 Tax=Triplophysa dalaica TaxID=1582913 RepID=UPI0024DF841B|nr:cytochrome P450 1A1 [Triplophysa dalaica]XP_056601748.1 cytochrome P450 1A1 [Triplophysa dalaica]XP_056601749.1 cytochrome P450 1A1 [Triplophysa dalaica]